MSRRGPFITVEGVDGAGKSTHVDLIIQTLTDRGFEVVKTQEPGGTDLGQQLRAQLKGAEMEPMTAALIAFAARSEHLSQKIKPALAAGQAVVSDRFTDSTYGYQGGGDGLAAEKIKVLEQLVQEGFGPDLTLFFDLSTQQAAQRRDARAQPGDKHDKFDARSQEWFNQVREAYGRRIQEDPDRFRVVDASGTIEQVAQQVGQEIEDFCDRFCARQASRPPGP